MNKFFFFTGCFSLFFIVKVEGDEVRWESMTRVQEVTPQKINSIVVTPSKVNLNTATKEQLLKLSGIGPKKAGAIILHRSQAGPFKKIGDLSKVKGFSKKVVAKIIETNKDLLELK